MPSAVSPPPELPVSGCITLRKLAAGAVQRHSCVSGAWARLIALHRGQPVPRGPGGAGGAGGERAARDLQPHGSTNPGPRWEQRGQSTGSSAHLGQAGGTGGAAPGAFPGRFSSSASLICVFSACPQRSGCSLVFSHLIAHRNEPKTSAQQVAGAVPARELPGAQPLRLPPLPQEPFAIWGPGNPNC